MTSQTHGHVSRYVHNACDVDTVTGLDTMPNLPSCVWERPKDEPAGTRDLDCFCAGLHGVGKGLALETCR